MSRPSFYFDPDGRGLEVFLGRIEARLMELAFERGELTVKQALAVWPEKPSPAYTTVMTVLVRLTRKGLLERKKRSRSFVYAPKVTRNEFLRDRVNRIRTCLKANFSK
ncbi:MAG TPA: BlaI/MecI/CopY family transcriptional regulator [candidate division Zixibacteria bacterium]|nr:BlaI/MecI/CopY family transcriptional regulator [candidate division Zixibacteria bacterium]